MRAHVVLGFRLIDGVCVFGGLFLMLSALELVEVGHIEASHLGSACVLFCRK